MLSWLCGISKNKILATGYKIHYAVEEATFRRHPKDITIENSSSH